jgi:hypothetical protein
MIPCSNSSSTGISSILAALMLICSMYDGNGFFGKMPAIIQNGQFIYFFKILPAGIKQQTCI